MLVLDALAWHLLDHPHRQHLAAAPTEPITIIRQESVCPAHFIPFLLALLFLHALAAMLCLLPIRGMGVSTA